LGGDRRGFCGLATGCGFRRCPGSWIFHARTHRRTLFPLAAGFITSGIIAARFISTGVISTRLVTPGINPARVISMRVRQAIEIFFGFFEEIRHVQERVALQAQIHESGLHARQNARYAAFVNAARERIFIGSLEKYFHQLVVFQNGHFCFVAIR
jgi:hypothetical protein